MGTGHQAAVSLPRPSMTRILRFLWWLAALPLATVGVPLSVLRNGLAGTVVLVALLVVLATTIGVVRSAGDQRATLAQHVSLAGPRALAVAPVVCFAATALGTLLGPPAMLGIVPLVLGGLWLLLGPEPAPEATAPTTDELMRRGRPSRMSTDELVRVLRAGAAAVRGVRDPVLLEWMAERRRRLLDELERRDPNAVRLLLDAEPHGRLADSP